MIIDEAEAYFYIIDVEKSIEAGPGKGTIMKYSIPFDDMSTAMRYLKQVHDKPFREGSLAGKIQITDIRRTTPLERRIYIKDTK